MWSVKVVVPFVLAEGVREMRLVPDECAVEQLVAAGLDPPFHDRVHSGNLDTAEHHGDAGVLTRKSRRLRTSTPILPSVR